MDILTIDIGTYSVKFLKTSLDRRLLNLAKVQEVVIANESKNFPPDMPPWEKQLKIVKSFFHKDYEGKVIFQVPNRLLTSRHLSFPTGNKKKILMMIPFQLEENLPYPARKSHYTSTISGTKEKGKATISIAKKDDFQSYYDLISRENIVPSLLTSELSALECYIKGSPLPENSVAILDLGHETTKAYFIYEGEILSNHTSHIAGKIIDDIISKTYNLNLREASKYKHENCFFLTEQQYENISQEHKEFAILMKKILSPLIVDFNRWELGHRVSCGHPVKTIYITGGTAKINNICSFLSHNFETHVEYFPHPAPVSSGSDYLEKNQDNFYLANLMAHSQKGKYLLANFLYGRYSGKIDQGIPLHSISFISLRTLIASIMVIVFLTIERFAIISPRLSEQDKINKKLIKTPEIALTTRNRREYRRNPEKILKVLKKKFKRIDRESSAIIKTTSINAIAPLSLLSSYIDNVSGVDLIKFKSNGEKSTAVFKSKESPYLQKLKSLLEEAELNYKKIEYKKSSKTLTLTFGKRNP